MATATSLKSPVTPEMRKIFEGYDNNHRHPGNKICHYIGVPAITFGTLGAFSYIPLPILPDLGFALWAFLSFWWIRMDWKISTPFSFLALGMYLLFREVSLPVNLALFLGGWAIAFFGHAVYEKTRPNLLTSVKESVSGPLLYFAKLIRYF